MPTDSLTNFLWNASLFTGGIYFATILVQPVKPKPVKYPTKQELEDDITECKNKINTAEIFIKHNEESIKTIRRELEEALKVLREENAGKETVKNKRKQLDKLEWLRGSKMDALECFKDELKKCEKRLEKFERERRLVV